MNTESIEENQKKIIKSVVKAFDVIEYMALSEKELGVTEISSALNYGVSATYHLVNTLKECGIVEQNPTTKKFKLAIKLWKLGVLTYEKNNIGIYLKPYLKRLKESTGETANLTILDNNKVLYIAQEESSRLLKMFTKLGAYAPLHCTGAGKILLAYQEDLKKEKILNSLKLEKYTDKTIINMEELKYHLENIKKLGYGVDDEEREVGVSCIGAPVFGADDEILACISISGPTSRFTEENQKQWIDVIKEISIEATNYIAKIKKSTY